MDYSVNVPESFPEMNTGVLAFRKNQLTDDLFKSWFKSCEEKLANQGKPLHDQTYFREVLYLSNARIATLTPEYNFRLIRKGFAIGKVKILHGRHPDLPKVDKLINATSAPRSFQRNSDLIELDRENYMNISLKR